MTKILKMRNTCLIAQLIYVYVQTNNTLHSTDIQAFIEIHAKVFDYNYPSSYKRQDHDIHFMPGSFLPKYQVVKIYLPIEK
jgi:hypothetical protein